MTNPLHRIRTNGAPGGAGGGGIFDGRDMLCFSHDWSGDPLSKTHLMRLLSRRNRILWVNSIGYRAPTASVRDLRRAAQKLVRAAAPLAEPEPNIHVLNPLVIPSHGSPRIRAFNRWFLRQQVRRAMRKLSFTRPINWVFNPAAAVVAGSLGEDLLLYYCVDEYAAFTGVRPDSLRTLEQALLARADLVVTSSEALYHSKRRANPRTILVRHGVDWSHYRAAAEGRAELPGDLRSLPRPIIGYFGLIADDWVDQDLVAHLAAKMPDASIVMLGRITTDVSRLKGRPNIHLLGHRPYASLPAYCRGFDAAMIPFPINDATLHANPLKAREYLAAGLPVVSTAIPEVQSLGHCLIGRTPDEFARQVERALGAPGPSLTRSDAVRDQSWDARLAEIETRLGAALSDRDLPPPLPSPLLRAA